MATAWRKHPASRKRFVRIRSTSRIIVAIRERSAPPARGTGADERHERLVALRICIAAARCEAVSCGNDGENVTPREKARDSIWLFAKRDYTSCCGKSLWTERCSSAQGLRKVEKLGRFRKANGAAFCAPTLPLCGKLTREFGFGGELSRLVNDCFRWQWHYSGTLR